MWDALNHVTGAANVRLHHCERRGALQMIATHDIGEGEEVIMKYKSLSLSIYVDRNSFIFPGSCKPNTHGEMGRQLLSCLNMSMRTCSTDLGSNTALS